MILQHTDLIERLEVFYSFDEIMQWLAKPHPQLGGECAAMALANGRADEVYEIVKRLEADAYV